MGTYTVISPFKTATRRFAAGQQVTEVDLDGSLTPRDRIRLKQIEANPEETVTEEPVVETDRSAAATEPLDEAAADGNEHPND